ncbi:MAG: T9SS type A sorting domain-containing protein, partial [Flavobacteriales bacterium]|nr:T9SS type A sorting domain-containing protein [Flavobacteriales bacterium]
LPSAVPHAFVFVPNGPDEWNSYTLVLPYEQFFTDNFRMKFEFESRLGNNIYLDDINIEAFTASDLLEREAYQSIPLFIYPNPTQGSAWLEFQTWTAHEAKIQLFDMTGRLLYSVDEGMLASGSQRMALPTESWARGTYVVALELDGIRSTKRLMVD